MLCVEASTSHPSLSTQYHAIQKSWLYLLHEFSPTRHCPTPHPPTHSPPADAHERTLAQPHLRPPSFST
jgi:hypothetical protein